MKYNIEIKGENGSLTLKDCTIWQTEQSLKELAENLAILSCGKVQSITIKDIKFDTPSETPSETPSK